MAKAPITGRRAATRRLINRLAVIRLKLLIQLAHLGLGAGGLVVDDAGKRRHLGSVAELFRVPQPGAAERFGAMQYGRLLGSGRNTRDIIEPLVFQFQYNFGIDPIKICLAEYDCDSANY